jgi:hypothetical protein
MHVVEIKEISVCSYVMVFHTPVMCADKKEVKKKENQEIVCIEDNLEQGESTDLSMNDFMFIDCFGSLAECWGKINEIDAASSEEEGDIFSSEVNAVEAVKDEEDADSQNIVSSLKISHDRISEKIAHLKAHGNLDTYLEEEHDEKGFEPTEQEKEVVYEVVYETEDETAPIESEAATTGYVDK